MAGAQRVFQNQLEQTTTDVNTQPLFNGSPYLVLEAMDQDQPAPNSERIEHNTVYPKERTSEITNDITRETPPPPPSPPKKKYEIMKDPAFLSLAFLRPPIYDLKTHESDLSFLSITQKATHH